MSKLDPRGLGHAGSYSADGLDELGLVGAIVLSAVALVLAAVTIAGVWQIGKWIWLPF